MSKWIETKNKLPDTINEFNESEMVLIFYQDTIEIGYYDDEDEWWWNENGNNLFNKVTHWMKLPSKPKQR